MKKRLRATSISLKWFFFFIGAIATLAYRVIIVLNFYSPLWVEISWYIGTIGFVLYFGYLFVVQAKEVKIIRSYGLLNIVKKLKIDEEDKKALKYVVDSNLNSKEKWNSLFIFSLSVIALAAGILLDLGIVRSLG